MSRRPPLPPFFPVPPPPPPPLLLVLLCFITPLALAAGHTVSHLPGFHGALPFHLETGYVVLDGPGDVELFYYFIPSEGNPAEDPLLLWMTGGPGCSAFSGLAFEIGPITFLKVRYNGSLPTLVLNPHPWTKVANIIFIDSPAGTGFSFMKNAEGYKIGEMSSSKEVVAFIEKWLDDHPKFISNPFYVAGGSYAGKLVPIVAHLLSKGIRSRDKQPVNLKGYLIGNPVTGERMDFFSRVPFFHGMGIISDEVYESTMKHCEGQDYANPRTDECAMNLDVVKKFALEIGGAHILEPPCPFVSPRPKGIKGDRRSLQVYNGKNFIATEIPDMECRAYGYYLSNLWANNNLARKALHVQKGTVGEWQRCNRDVTLQSKGEVESVIMYHLNMTSRGYRALVYSGDHDAVIPFLGTQAWVGSLGFSIVDDWRSWYVDGQVAGYTRTYSNKLTFATVKGAGHTAPEYKRKECLAMIQRWLSHMPL